MSPRYTGSLLSASVLVLALAQGLAQAQPAPASDGLGLTLPEQPELLILDSDIVPNGHDRALGGNIVTGTVAPSQQPASGLSALEIKPAPAATQGVDDRPSPATSALDIRSLDIPAIELPETDPELAPVLVSPPAAPLRATLPVEIAVPPPDLPAVVVELPAATDLAAEIAARQGEALELARLSDRERADIRAAYEAHQNKPFWIDNKGWSAAALKLVGQLGRAGDDGLRPSDYPLPVFEASDRGSLAEADVRLSALAVLYARDARGARIDPRRLSKLLTPTLSLPSATEVLSELTASSDPGAALAAYNPPHEGYRRLKARLAELREHQDDTPLVRIPAGPALKVGMRDVRVPLVRARLGLGPSDEPVFDRSTSIALLDFQKRAGLPANGILGERTIAALGMPASANAELDIIAQMERWRWLPADLGATHVMVNVPEFQLRVLRNGAAIHQTRVIVGKTETPTPIFSHRMDHVIVNPSWYVPPSILKKEFLPGLAADPDYAAKRGYVVTRRGNAISVRQPPGERNALGWIKFMFPNEHAVYLHDTPNRRLFANERRAFSHGCVRVNEPFMLADQVLGPEWTTARLKRMIGAGERMIKLQTPLPIHLVYNTHVVQDDGSLRTFDDLYGFHRLVRQALAQRS